MNVWDFRPYVANPDGREMLTIELSQADIRAIRRGEKMACVLPDGNSVVVKLELGRGA